MKKLVFVGFLAVGLASCKPREENIVPASLALVGTWNVMTATTVTTTPTGGTTTTGRNYPAGSYTVVYAAATYQPYTNGVAQGSPVAYSVTGTTYTFQEAGKTHSARIDELTANRFVTTEFAGSAGNTVMLTTTLTR